MIFGIAPQDVLPDDTIDDGLYFRQRLRAAQLQGHDKSRPVPTRVIVETGGAVGDQIIQDRRGVVVGWRKKIFLHHLWIGCAVQRVELFFVAGVLGGFPRRDRFAVWPFGRPIVTAHASVCPGPFFQIEDRQIVVFERLVHSACRLYALTIYHRIDRHPRSGCHRRSTTFGPLSP